MTLGGSPTADLGDEAAKWIGVIQQRTYLFNMTLRDNLRIGREDATDDEVWDALGRVGLRSMAERLPNGLDTLVDEAGLRFSGGERHRVALARVLLQDVPVVILDEPTVGLDPITERALLDDLFEALAGKTVIMITHHLAGVDAMDRVVFVEDGRIALDARGRARVHERALPTSAGLRPRAGGGPLAAGAQKGGCVLGRERAHGGSPEQAFVARYDVVGLRAFGACHDQVVLYVPVERAQLAGDPEVG